MNPVAQGSGCSICGGPLTPHERLLRGICHQAACRRIHRTRQLLARRNAEAEVLGIRDPDSFPLVVVPANERPIHNLPERRRRRFRDFLTGLISEAAAQSLRGVEAGDARLQPASEDVPAGELLVLGGACATCRGHCCPQGRDHAFLDVDRIRRYMSEHPGDRPRDVLEAFLARLPNRTYESSCVYHTARGCALPKAMRGDLCNRYYCEGLESFKHSIERNGAARGFVVAEERLRLPVRSAFVDPHGLRTAEPELR